MTNVSKMGQTAPSGNGPGMLIPPADMVTGGGLPVLGGPWGDGDLQGSRLPGQGWQLISPKSLSPELSPS